MPSSRDLLGGGVDHGPGGLRARRPQPAAGHRAACRAAGHLYERPSPRPAQRAQPAGEKHEALLGHRGGPAAKGIDVRVGDGPSPERPVAARARGTHGVHDQARRAQLLTNPHQRRLERGWIGGVGRDPEGAALANRRRGLLAARHGRAAPALRHEVVEDRAAQVAGAEHDGYAF